MSDPWLGEIVRQRQEAMLAEAAQGRLAALHRKARTRLRYRQTREATRWKFSPRIARTSRSA
jgi:hypothetical protein